MGRGTAREAGGGGVFNLTVADSLTFPRYQARS
jgi:hypothetical protein